MPKFSNAKINEKVWSSKYGWGTVILNNSGESHYPIQVQYNNLECGKLIKCYTVDGRENDYDKYPELFWNEFHILTGKEDRKQFDLIRFLKTNLEPKEFEYDIHNLELYFSHSSNSIKIADCSVSESIGVVYFKSNDKINGIVDTLNQNKITSQQLRDAYKKLGWL